jgi:hypothetical protein
VEAADGDVIVFEVITRVDTPAELARLRMGGIMTEALLEKWR